MRWRFNLTDKFLLRIIWGQFVIYSSFWFSSEIPEFTEASKDLSKKRGPALYGYEAELKPASDIFSRKDAEEALASAANDV